MLFWDDVTQYCEGMNSGGVSIISASLMVKDDEMEIQVRSKTPSKDGAKIKKKYHKTTNHCERLLWLKLPSPTPPSNASGRNLSRSIRRSTYIRSVRANPTSPRSAQATSVMARIGKALKNSLSNSRSSGLRAKFVRLIGTRHLRLVAGEPARTL